MYSLPHIAGTNDKRKAYLKLGFLFRDVRQALYSMEEQLDVSNNQHQVWKKARMSVLDKNTISSTATYFLLYSIKAGSL